MKWILKSRAGALPTMVILFSLLGFSSLLNADSRRVEKEETPSATSIKKIFREDSLILLEVVRNGRLSRNYYIDGHLAWAESDETGDGVLDTVFVFGQKGMGDFEVFNRAADGTIHPVSDEELGEIRAKKAEGDRRRLEFQQMLGSQQQEESE